MQIWCRLPKSDLKLRPSALKCLGVRPLLPWLADQHTALLLRGSCDVSAPTFFPYICLWACLLTLTIELPFQVCLMSCQSTLFILAPREHDVFVHLGIGA